jgi:hypothetical protein
MATIEEAVAVGIERAEAEKLLTYGQSVLNAAVKERSKQEVDYLAKFKEKYADAYAAAESALATLKKHVTDFTTANPKAKLAYDPEQLVKSTKRGSSKRTGTGKTREKVDLVVIAQHYANGKLTFEDKEAVLQADGTVKDGNTTHKDPNAWMRSVTTKTRPGVWYNIIKIDVGEKEPISLAKAYSQAKNAVAPVGEPLAQTNGKSK